MGVAWAVCVVGWVAVTLQPDIYESQARVYVDTRTALSPVIQGLAISQDVDAQINRVRQSLLGRPQLLLLAQEAGLDAGAGSPEALDRLLTQIRSNIRLDGRDSSGGTVYTVGYQSPDRERSLKWQAIYRAVREGAARLADSEKFDMIVVDDSKIEIQTQRAKDAPPLEAQAKAQITQLRVLNAGKSIDVTEKLIVQINNNRSKT